MLPSLPYDMGNAGDLLKHGVLAEFVRWQCERGKSFRFIDLFGGKPWESVKSEVADRVQALPECVALKAAQTNIATEKGRRYYGSGHLVKNVAEQVGNGKVCVLTNDSCQARRKALKDSGLSMLEDSPRDAYKAFKEIALKKDDLILLDPFADFLKSKADAVIPRIAEVVDKHGAAVILFALNLDPCNSVGRNFEKLLKTHLPSAWRMTFPPLRFTGVKGESKYHAEVIVAARSLEQKNDKDVSELKRRLEKLAMHLAKIPAAQLRPRLVAPV